MLSPGFLGGLGGQKLEPPRSQDSVRTRETPSMQLSVIIITFNEEANIGRTLASVQPVVADGKGEIVVVDSGSTDRTVEIAKSFGAKVFVEEWKGFAAQKNSAIEKAGGEWILSLDADEELSREARDFIDLHLTAVLSIHPDIDAIWLNRRNYFLQRWIRFGGFYPDPKLRFFRRGSGSFENRAVHEDLQLSPGKKAFNPESLHDEHADFHIIHHSYPTLSDYIAHMNHYSSLGAEMVVSGGKVRFSFINIVLRPMFTFIYNYFVRLGFLDGREGLLLHLYHAVYVSWKYAKAWEISWRNRPEALHE